MLALILHSDSTPMRHRLQLGMIDVGRDDHACPWPSSIGPARGNLFLLGDEGHLLGDHAQAREVHLAHVRVAGSSCFSLAPDDPIPSSGRDGVVVPVRMLLGRVCRRLRFQTVAKCIAAHAVSP